MFKFSIILFVLFYSSSYLQSQQVFWASKVVNCSVDFNNNAPLSPNQILGKYNVMTYFGKTYSSFTISPGLKRNIDIEIKFDTIIIAKQIVLCENYNPGAVSRITLYSPEQKQRIIFENVNPQQLNTEGRFWLLKDKLENFPIAKMRIEFNTTNFIDYYQIDAVGISANNLPIEPKINYSKDAQFNVQPENLKNINSDYSELAPIISSDGKVLYFTRQAHPDNIGNEKQQDVWYSVSNDGIEFGKPILLGSPINNKFNNFAISVTPDNNTLLLGNVFLKNQPPAPGLSLSHRTENGWSYPEPLIINGMNSKSKQNSYSLGNDGKTLLLSINRDDSFGEHDLYVSFLSDNGTWTQPMNLGPKINTASNEESPFLASDNKTLYFSGDGYPGLGRNDIFMTRRLDDTWQNWSEPINLGNKINSIYWDAYFSVTASGDFAYFVSSTQAPFSEDIYRIPLPKAVQPTSVVLISGKVLNKINNKPISASIIYEELPSGKEIGIAHSNPLTGEYKITLPAGKNYGFLAKADSFISINENLNLSKLNEFKEIKKDLFLVPFQAGQTIKLNNIFFETGKYDILPDSYPELNRVIQLMNENPNLKIKIAGHTDNIGGKKENQILSENRAKAITNYFVSKNISQNRLVSEGYGKSKPITSNETEDGRSQNRRVEFIILKK